MKLIKPKFEILEQAPGIEGVYKQIEIAGRTCYKSEDKITADSAKGFVERMIKSGHGAMLEHGTVYLTVSEDSRHSLKDSPLFFYYANTYSKGGVVRSINGESIVSATTNLRVLVENNRLDDLKYICEPTEYHEKRVTVRFECDRVTGESFLRHRAVDEDHPLVENVTREDEKDIDSFARESTRYCNYSNKKKFGSNINIIQPCWTYDIDVDSHDNENLMRDIFAEYSENDSSIPTKLEAVDYWLASNKFTEYCYMKLIECGWQAQQARTVLPMDIKSPLVMTGFVSDWKHFFDLRDDVAAHPQAQELARPLHEEFIRRGYLEE